MHDVAPDFDYPIHQPHLPSLVAGRETKRHDLLICGGGPVGLALALVLAQHGIASVVIDADTTVCQGSRAICLSRRTMEILSQLGVADAFVQKGLAWTTGRSFYRTAEVLAFDMPHGPDDRFAPMTNIAQYDIEQLLVDAIARYPDLIEMRWGTELTGVNVSARMRSASASRSMPPAKIIRRKRNGWWLATARAARCARSWACGCAARRMKDVMSSST
jgi:3-(3-hydroxy-phenyl)propionate hydroxylase